MVTPASCPPPCGWQVPPDCGVPPAGSTQMSPSSQSDMTWQRSPTPCLQPASARGDSTMAKLTKRRSILLL